MKAVRLKSVFFMLGRNRIADSILDVERIKWLRNRHFGHNGGAERKQNQQRAAAAEDSC
jgi:hypothetical protein